jgi:hypothetical protein
MEVIMKVLVVIVVGFAALPALASAQEGMPDGSERRTAIYLQTGYSPTSAHMGGAAIGGVVARDLTHRLSAEASLSYLGRGMASSALTASASLVFSLRPTHEKAVPYLAAGGGVYRASFDMGSGRFSGPMNMGGSMMGGYGMMGMGSWDSTAQWDYGQMPHFYGARLAGQQGGSRPYDGRASFTDPVVSLGGGIRIDVGSHLYLRPDLRALVVVSESDASTSGLFTVNLGYRF